MAIRALSCLLLLAGLCALAGCGDEETGPIRVTAIGGPAALVNPNLQPLDPPEAFLTDALGQGLVRFDATGEIEPALAQSWIVSDDGLRYTFRIRRATWADGSPVTAQQVAARLRAALGRASRNSMKSVLGAVESVTPMTDFVIEIALRGPRPNFLQLLAQPELGIVQDNGGTGPYRVLRNDAQGLRLTMVHNEDEENEALLPDLALQSGRGALAVARFAAGQTDLVLGGGIGDLPIAAAADLPSARLVFDPVGGLFGLAFAGNRGPLSDAALRRALAMSIDRDGLAAALGVPRLQARTGIVAPGIQELPVPAQPDWAALGLDERRDAAARAVAAFGGPAPIHLRIAMPDGPGYNLVFAYLKRDWAMIGIETERVPAGAESDLLLIDQVAPANLASWYLRHFTCDASAICDAGADQALQAARLASATPERQTQLANADRILSSIVPFIPLTAPVRWSLVSPRLTGFRPSPFARHPAVTLVAEGQ